MNPNQMMIAKAMVAQTALREEAAESRRSRNKAGCSDEKRTKKCCLDAIVAHEIEILNVCDNAAYSSTMCSKFAAPRHSKLFQ